MDLGNYNLIHFINGKAQWQTLTGYLVPKNRRDIELLTCTREIPRVTCCQRRCDVIMTLVTPVTGVVSQSVSQSASQPASQPASQSVSQSVKRAKTVVFKT